MCDCFKKQPWVAIGILAWIYLIGVIGLSLDYSRELFMKAVPFTLLISLAFLVLVNEKFNARLLVLAIVVYLAGFLVEVVGVATGLVFGGYSYGSTLGVKLWGAPLMIGVNWLLLVYCVWVMVSRLKWNKVLLALVGAVLMVIYDLFMEPVAIWLDMWSWESVNIPLQNYVAWFIISFVFFLLAAVLTPKLENKIAPGLFIIQLVFFIALNLVLMRFI